MSVISLSVLCHGEAIYIKKSGIDLVNTHLLAKNYQNIPGGL